MRTTLPHKERINTMPLTAVDIRQRIAELKNPAPAPRSAAKLKPKQTKHPAIERAKGIPVEDITAPQPKIEQFNDRLTEKAREIFKHALLVTVSFKRPTPG